MAERSHYTVLGVAPSASAEEIRRAHRQLARMLHPDRLVDSSAAERELAERRMREVNAAWTVLSDPQRRRTYDRSLLTERVAGGASGAGGAAAGAGGGSRAAGAAAAGRRSAPDPAPRTVPPGFEAATEPHDPDDVEVSAAEFWMLRRLPVIVALVVAAVLFIVTAYAGDDRDGGGGAGTAGDAPTTTVADAEACVAVYEGRSAVLVPCTGDHDGRVVTSVEKALDCPEGTRYVVVSSNLVCVDGDAGG